MEISFGVLGSLLPDLEEEGLEGGVLSLETSSLGLSGGGSSAGWKSGTEGLGGLLGALDLDSFVMEGEREQRRIS